ncbi:MAG: alpha/beta hydrolase [Actinomycetota bacterium]|nr:alpha/beta hydrolase [Actinomycetota bacterium]
MDLHVTEGGAGVPVVLLHGLTATHRYVVMGSRALERSGHRVIAYDARGHGASAAAPDGVYDYAALAGDLLAVMDGRGIERAVLAGASMGAHTILRVAIEAPERVGGLVVITPAYDPVDSASPQTLARWDALADGLERGGVDGFVEAFDTSTVPEAWRETVTTVLRQRLSAHEHPEAVADAIRGVPRSQPFATLHDLAQVDAPTVVVADRDEPDPGHPLSVGEAYAELIPGAELVVEEPGKSPIAWQGGQLSRVIAGVAGRAS